MALHMETILYSVRQKRPVWTKNQSIAAWNENAAKDNEDYI